MNVKRAAEVVLGIIFLGAGINGLIVWFGVQPLLPTSPKAEQFLGTGYFLALEKGTEMICGLLLLTRHFVPLALLVLAPIVINIIAFHIFIDADLLVLALIVLTLEVLLLWNYRAHYEGLLKK
ncbi:hypothetical protein [Marinicrinis lubricantis]|uniref:DoxX family protein n=1 Tax=Marinicrinis lubricantis TaxID=2086470 RepID=A0ABW1IQA4_9BACL